MAADVESVRLARSEVLRWFRDLGRSNESVAASIAVAVSEAVGNVVRHAYAGRQSGRVDIDAQLDGDAILLSVADRGGGMTARSDRDHNGMGLPVIGRVADGVTVVTDGGGTRLSMRFDLAAANRRPSLFASQQDRSLAAGAR